MKAKIIAALLTIAATAPAFSEVYKESSLDGRLSVIVDDKGDGRPTYSVEYDGKTFLLPSRLGLKTNAGNFYDNIKVVKDGGGGTSGSNYCASAKVTRFKINYKSLILILANAQGQEMQVTFSITNNDVAFRYTFPNPVGSFRSIRVDEELTSFNVPANATAFMAPQDEPASGWCRATPAYETRYSQDAPLTAKSQFGEGFTFPALFNLGENRWMLISETGSCGNYPGCGLSEYTAGEGFTIKFPSPLQNGGIGTSCGAFAIPGSTPWRTITVGNSLKPIVETMAPYIFPRSRFAGDGQMGTNLKPGRYVWSWILWQDPSINYDDQKAFIDMAAKMGYEYSLIDANWDKEEKIGWTRMQQLCEYAREKNVRLILWYSSAGNWNDTGETPRNIMDRSATRLREMRRLRRIGVAGIKVDYFGGDKQETMQLYEDILSDASDCGLFVIFHGCTLPRGWEAMYDNFVSAEAVRASENVYFNEESAKSEAQELATFAFTRNAVASMDYGGTLMNRYMSRDNKSRHPRHTSDILEIAAAYFTQTPIQCVGIMPNNLDELPEWELQALRQIPAGGWDEIRFIDGYPGKYFIVARRQGDNWYVAGLNATEKEMRLTLDLPMFAGQTVRYYNDKPAKDGGLPEPQLQELKIGSKGKAKVSIQPNGGLIIRK